MELEENREISFLYVCIKRELSLKSDHASAFADYSSSTGHNIKWDHFEILESDQCDIQCKIKETLLIQDLKPALNENVGSEKLFLH